MNVVVLCGNVGSVDELKRAGETPILKFSLATNYRSKGEKKTDWHRCVFFGERAEKLAPMVVKGQKIGVRGEIRYGKYTDKSGVEKYTTDIIVNDLDFLSPKAEGGGEAPAPAFTADEEPPFLCT